MASKIALLESNVLDLPDAAFEPLRELGELTLFANTPHDPAEVVARCEPFECLLVNKVPFTTEVLARLPNLRYIGVVATGTNIIDLSAATDRGITVTNVPSYSARCVAQHTLAFILTLSSRIPQHAASIRNGDWCTSPNFAYWHQPIFELHGKTAGLVGYGQIGQRVGDLLRPFGTQVIAHTRTERDLAPATWVSLDDLFAQADIVSLHCPQTPHNAGFVNATLLQRMKRGAFLVNTSRGGLVDEAAVAEALCSGQLGGYAADVLTREPARPGNPLLAAPNCLLSPHLAWSSIEARTILMETVTSNLRAFLDGQAENVVA